MKNKLKNKKESLKLIYSKMKKKGVSEVLGYILLVAFAIIMSFIVYQGLKTYVPAQNIECPDGVSIFVKEAECALNADGNYDLNLTIKNNGRYNIAGYYIHYTNSSNKTVATKDLVNFLKVQGTEIYNASNAVLFEASTSGNPVNISSSKFVEFKNVSERIYSLDILPIRFQKEENRLRIVSCGKALAREKISC
jgi:flagellin-like protein